MSLDFGSKPEYSEQIHTRRCKFHVGSVLVGIQTDNPGGCKAEVPITKPPCCLSKIPYLLSHPFIHLMHLHAGIWTDLDSMVMMMPEPGLTLTSAESTLQPAVS